MLSQRDTTPRTEGDYMRKHPNLNDKLTEQDDVLRQTFDQIIADAVPGTEGRALLRLVASGLAAIHERQRITAVLIERIP